MKAANRQTKGFTLVEMLLTIAVMSIMAALVISSFSNAAQDSRRVVARQQQAALQEAVNNWVSGQLIAGGSLNSVKTTYNTAANGKARLGLVASYLDDGTFAHFNSETSSAVPNKILSEALKKVGDHIEMPSWADGSYPKVNLVFGADG